MLAAGGSRRMGGGNKLLADLGGAPLIVRTTDNVLASAARPVIVVTGHQAADVAAALAQRPVSTVFNPDHATGMASSLRAGLAALPADIDGVVVCLGDMPEVTGGLIDRLIAAFDPAAGRAICAPTHRGRRGNPVLWGRAFFDEMARLSGDSGAKGLLERGAAQFCAVADGGEEALRDVDEPNDLLELRNRRLSAGK